MYDITDIPSQLQYPVPQFAQIGVPRNLTVNQTSTSNEFVASWNPPEFGEENLKLYVVRWWREPGHILQGVAETRNLYYNGNYGMIFNYTFINLFSFHFSERSFTK